MKIYELINKYIFYIYTYPFFFDIYFSVIERWDLQKLLSDLNPEFNETHTEIAPDGDVLLTEDQIKNFKVRYLGILENICINFICIIYYVQKSQIEKLARGLLYRLVKMGYTFETQAMP